MPPSTQAGTDPFAAKLARQREKAEHPEHVADLTPHKVPAAPSALPPTDPFLARMAKQREKAEHPEGVPELVPPKRTGGGPGAGPTTPVLDPVLAARLAEADELLVCDVGC